MVNHVAYKEKAHTTMTQDGLTTRTQKGLLVADTGTTIRAIIEYDSPSMPWVPDKDYPGPMACHGGVEIKKVSREDGQPVADGGYTFIVDGDPDGFFNPGTRIRVNNVGGRSYQLP